MTALEAHDHISPLCQPVDNLALAFIAPLRANDGDICHFSAPVSKGIARKPVLAIGTKVHPYASFKV